MLERTNSMKRTKQSIKVQQTIIYTYVCTLVHFWQDCTHNLARIKSLYWNIGKTI